MDTNRIKTILILAVATFGALYLGVSAATAQFETIAWIIGGTGLSICLMLGKKIWMIIPFMSVLNLSLIIPTRPDTGLLSQAIFLGFCTLLFLMRKLPFRIAFTELGFWTALIATCVLQTYIRNPVGLNIIGGESVGAKPYVLFGAALVTSVLLSTYKISPTDLKWILRLSIIGGILNFTLLAIGTLVPRLGVWYGAVGGGEVNSTGQQTGAYGAEGATRIVFVRDFGRNLSLWIGSFKSPIRACFHPVSAPLVLISLACAAFSGYRSEVAAVGFTYLVAISYRGGMVAVVVSCLSLAMGIVMLSVINLATPLPVNIQRSLSFLPGTWDQALTEDAEQSTEWRVKMWEEALLTDFWIKNKLLGDGLGMTRQEYNFIRSFGDKQISGGVGSGDISQQQEFFMASGAYHSGPVSTIRAIGYAGLLILLIAQIRLAVHAHRQIQRTRNTEWFPLALFVGIPLIWSPFFFVLIFGTFSSGATSFLLGSAWVRVLENNLPLPLYVIQRRTPYILQQRRTTSDTSSQ
jgi:hypothetical protein